jgi:hypothetical protein
MCGFILGIYSAWGHPQSLIGLAKTKFTDWFLTNAPTGLESVLPFALATLSCGR